MTNARKKTCVRPCCPLDIHTRRRAIPLKMYQNESDKVEAFESEPLLHAILDAVQDAMVVIDEQGRIRWFSATAQRMFGYTEGEVFGENVSTLMPSPDRERHDNYLRHYRDTGERKIIGIGRVTTARRRDGSTFPIELSIGEASSNGVRVFTGFIRDLTERQQTEKRLHNLQDELTHVSRVTAMGTLATAIAHELNQPLTAITNYVEAARDLLRNASTEHVATVLEALEQCASEAMRAGQMVRRLRDFIVRGDTERQVVPLSRLVNEASALAFMSAGSRRLEFTVEIDPQEHVFVDRVQIQQVLLNLIRNAIEAMEQSPLKQLRISSRKVAGRMIEVEVADSGPGLPAAVAENIFLPFRSTKAAGMGVGLSISRTIIEAHEGRVWVSGSSLGGAAFLFTLPDASTDELLD